MSGRYEVAHELRTTSVQLPIDSLEKLPAAHCRSEQKNV